MIAIPVYILMIAIAEVVGALANVVFSAVIHLVLIILLSGHYILGQKTSYRQVLPVLLLAPLLRILSLVMPVREVPQIYWYGLVGLPLLLAALLAARFLDLSTDGLGLRVRSTLWQVPIALTGLPLGIAAFLLLRPEPLISGFDWPAILAGSAILAVFSGFTEEFIFRGLLQQATRQAFGVPAALLFSSALFAVMYFGSLSLGYIVFIALVGLFFGFCAIKTGSILGVSLAHSLLNIGLIIFWPLVMSILLS